MKTQIQSRPILLFNDECAVCRSIAHWVQKSAEGEKGGARIVQQPIGDDPDALRLLNPDLDIWDAYETIHVLMPDGSMKLGGEAVAEVLLDLPNTKWFAGVFSVRTFGLRPFQAILNVAYAILAAVRPLFGCESCGGPGVLLRSLAWIRWTKAIFGGHHGPSRTLHFTSLSATGSRPLRATEELHGQTRHL